MSEYEIRSGARKCKTLTIESPKGISESAWLACLAWEHKETGPLDHHQLNYEVMWVDLEAHYRRTFSSEFGYLPSTHKGMQELLSQHLGTADLLPPGLSDVRHLIITWLSQPSLVLEVRDSGYTSRFERSAVL